jgi:hypothetical protein
MFAIDRIASLYFSQLAIRIAALGSRSYLRWPMLALLLPLGAATLGTHAAFLLLLMTAILLPQRWGYTRMSDRHFARAVNLLLIVSDLSYIL